MSWITTITIDNDALEQLKDDFSFHEALYSAIKDVLSVNQPIQIPIGNFEEACKIIGSHDSDYYCLTAIGKESKALKLIHQEDFNEGEFS